MTPDWTPSDQAQHAIVSAALDEAMHVNISSNPKDYPARQALYAYCNRLRSQAESGLTGRYNPETHMVAGRAELVRFYHGIGETLDEGVIAEGYTRDFLVSMFSTLDRWLSPSPETPEPK